MLICMMLGNPSMLCTRVVVDIPKLKRCTGLPSYSTVTSCNQYPCLQSTAWSFSQQHLRLATSAGGSLAARGLPAVRSKIANGWSGCMLQLFEAAYQQMAVSSGCPHVHQLQSGLRIQTCAHTVSMLTRHRRYLPKHQCT